MNDLKKARKVIIPILEELKAETSPLQKTQIKDRISLAMQIEKLIKLKGFKTYKEFADHIGRSSSEVSRWLSGYNNLTQNTLSEIAFGLDVNICELFNSKLSIQVINLEKSIELDVKGFVKKDFTRNLNVSEIKSYSSNLVC